MHLGHDDNPWRSHTLQSKNWKVLAVEERGGTQMAAKGRSTGASLLNFEGSGNAGILDCDKSLGLSERRVT